MPSLSIGARRKLALPVAALAAATALVGAFVPASFADDGGAAAAAPAPFASAPTTPAGEFFAELCSTGGGVDQTTENPKANQGSNVMPDLTRVFGQRLADYNAGSTVLLYTSTGGSGGGTPNCGVHYDAVTDGPVSEWMFCTDQTAKTCSQVDKNGLLHQGSDYVGQLENRTGNPGLSPDQEKIISYIIRHDMPVPVDNFLSTVDVASNKTVDSRNAKQNLVWCVSDPVDFGEPLAYWCDEAIGADKQAAILASMPKTPELTITPASTEVVVAGEAKVTLTTNLVNQPITLTADAPGLALCEPQTDVTLSTDGELTISSTVTGTKTVDLCISSATPAEILVQASATAHAGDEAAWVQSPGGAAGIECQVYALTRAGAATDMNATATVNVTEDNSGGGTAGGDDSGGGTAGGDDSGGGTAGGDDSDKGANGDNAESAVQGDDSDKGAQGNNNENNAQGNNNENNAQGGNAEGNNAQGAANGAKGGLAATGAASPLIAGTAALLLVAAGAGALAMRRRSAR
ncbi:hypothetical protein ACXR2W_04370 [Leucobacter sp. HY1908]